MINAKRPIAAGALRLDVCAYLHAFIEFECARANVLERDNRGETATAAAVQVSGLEFQHKNDKQTENCVRVRLVCVD